jgi:hypothetical protein
MCRWVLLGLLVGLAGCEERRVQSCAAAPAREAVTNPQACVAECGGTSPECTPPCGKQVEFDWVVELDRAPCLRGPVVAAELDGLVLAAGGTKNAPGYEQRWVATMSQTGCIQDIQIDGEDTVGAEGLVMGVAAHPEHGAYAVGKQELLVGDDLDVETRVWIRRYAADGTIEWTIEELAEADAAASGVAIDADGSALVVGGSGSDQGQGWLRRYAEDGTRSDVWTLDEEHSTRVLDVVVAGDGQRWVSGWTADDSLRPASVITDHTAFVASLGAGGDIEWLSFESSMTWARLAPWNAAPMLVGASRSVSRYDTSGHEVWTTSLAQRQIDVLRGQVLPSGSILLAGSRLSTPVLVLLDPDGAVSGVTPVPGSGSGEVSDVSVGQDGAIFMAGLRRVSLEPTTECVNWVARAAVR